MFYYSIDYEDFMNLYKKLLQTDILFYCMVLLLASDNPFHFIKNLESAKIIYQLNISID